MPRPNKTTPASISKHRHVRLSRQLNQLRTTVAHLSRRVQALSALQPPPVCQNSRPKSLLTKLSADIQLQALRFLDRKELEPVSLVSKAMKTLIEKSQEKLPRGAIGSILISQLIEISACSTPSRSFQRKWLPDDGIPALSSELDGRLSISGLLSGDKGENLLSSASFDSVAMISISAPFGKIIDFSVLNRLTNHTAFQLLHLLYHLHACSVGTVEWRASLNPFILSLVPIPGDGRNQFRLYVNMLRVERPLSVRLENAARMMHCQIVTNLKSTAIPPVMNIGGGRAELMDLINFMTQSASFTPELRLIPMEFEPADLVTIVEQYLSNRYLSNPIKLFSMECWHPQPAIPLSLFDTVRPDACEMNAVTTEKDKYCHDVRTWIYRNPLSGLRFSTSLTGVEHPGEAQSGVTKFEIQLIDE